VDTRVSPERTEPPAILVSRESTEPQGTVASLASMEPAVTPDSVVLLGTLDFRERVDTAVLLVIQVSQASTAHLGIQASAERTVKAATLASVGLVPPAIQASAVRLVTPGQMALR
jgi:hypothetical protein